MEYNYYEQQNEWLQQRLGKFTASEIHKLLERGRNKDEYFGKGAATYVRTKLAEILTGTVVELTDVPAIEWGNSNELEAVTEFEKVTGLKVDYYGKANPKFFQYSDYSGGSPDGLTNNDAVIEVKCPANSAYHVMFLLMDDDDLKERKDYFAQVQMNMLCTGKQKAYFVSYDPRMTDPSHKIRIMEVKYDEEFIETLKERIAEAEKYMKALYAIIDENELAAELNLLAQ
jgi:hypothetical protein